MTACSHCGRDLPEDAAFCPACGRRAGGDAGDTGRAFPLDIQHAEAKWFGLEPPVLVLVVMAVLVVLGIVLVTGDNFAVGVIALILAACLLPSFLAGARRWPDAPLARVGLSTAERVRDEADVAVVSISTWSNAGRELVRLRKEQFTLRRERDATIRELGLSVYSDDGRADELKAAAKELDERIEANEREQAKTMAGAKRRVRKERAAVVSTQIIPPDEASGPLPEERVEDEREPVNPDDVGLDPEREDGGERGAEPGSAPEGDPQEGDAPGEERKQAE